MDNEQNIDRDYSYRSRAIRLNMDPQNSITKYVLSSCNNALYGPNHNKKVGSKMQLNMRHGKRRVAQ
jgi:hypothetical protein